MDTCTDPGKQSDNIKDKGGVAIGFDGKEIEARIVVLGRGVRS